MAKESGAAIDWAAFEQLMASEVAAIAAKQIRSNSQKNYYAGAFYCFYRDYETMHLPLFSLNSNGKIDPDIKWSPADFEFQAELFKNPKLQTAMTTIEAVYRDGGKENADAVESQFFKSMINITKAISKSLKESGLVNDDFIVYFDDPDEEVGLIIKCVGRKTLARVAPEILAW